MDRNKLEQHILKRFGVHGEQPWMKYPSFSVFRHADNKKWFAVIMAISKKRLGIDSDEITEVVNLKCDCNMIPYLTREDGFFPAYHMSKTHWITVALDGSVDDNTISELVKQSFDLTCRKQNRNAGN